jgi:preprotein translocase subunit SecA
VHQAERYVMLQILDGHWREHLAALDHLRQGIHLRGYAQKNPKQEYKREAFELFGAMVESVKLEIVKTLTNVQYGERPPEIDDQPHIENVRAQHGELEEAGAEANGDLALAEAATKKRPITRPMQKVGRNDPCPCGSGKKYKHCHGKLA